MKFADGRWQMEDGRRRMEDFMRNDHFRALALSTGSLFIIACPNTNDDNKDASSDSSPTTANPDAGLACCPVGFDLYACQPPGGGAGFACHNPAMGCASSQTCGQGCDPQVSGRCACVQTELCIQGDHFDTTLCKCVPCVDTVMCIQGDRFDTTVCGCVPNVAPNPCSSATDCTGALPALCQQCADGGSGCAHFTCVAGQCQVAYCP